MGGGILGFGGVGVENSVVEWNGCVVFGDWRLICRGDKKRHTKGLSKEKGQHRERENTQKGGKQ